MLRMDPGKASFSSASSLLGQGPCWAVLLLGTEQPLSTPVSCNMDPDSVPENADLWAPCQAPGVRTCWVGVWALAS